MYTAFYGLKEKPFSLLPDPGYLYPRTQHERALTLLRYALANQAGFSVICGDTGAGKTTLIRCLLDELGPDTTVGLITNTHRSFGELLRWVLMAFGLRAGASSEVQMYERFLEFVIGQHAQGKRTLLIVDEAQNLTVDTLEELRTLSNVNADKHQVLQVILAGQPALRETLKLPQLTRFVQRIRVDYYLDSLNAAETRAYIEHRVQVAGSTRTLFTPAACAAVHRATGGTPRLVNLLCDTALIYGFAEQARTIDATVIAVVLDDRRRCGALPLFGTVTDTFEDAVDAALIAPSDIVRPFDPPRCAVHADTPPAVAHGRVEPGTAGSEPATPAARAAHRVAVAPHTVPETNAGAGQEAVWRTVTAAAPAVEPVELSGLSLNAFAAARTIEPAPLVIETQEASPQPAGCSHDVETASAFTPAAEMTGAPEPAETGYAAALQSASAETTDDAADAVESSAAAAAGHDMQSTPANTVSPTLDAVLPTDRFEVMYEALSVPDKVGALEQVDSYDAIHDPAPTTDRGNAEPEQGPARRSGHYAAFERADRRRDMTRDGWLPAVSAVLLVGALTAGFVGWTYYLRPFGLSEPVAAVMAGRAAIQETPPQGAGAANARPSALQNERAAGPAPSEAPQQESDADSAETQQHQPPPAEQQPAAEPGQVGQVTKDRERQQRLAQEQLEAARRAAEAARIEAEKAEKLVAEKLAAEKQAAERQAAERQAAERQAAERQAAVKELAEQQAVDKPPQEKQALERQVSDQRPATPEAGTPLPATTSAVTGPALQSIQPSRPKYQNAGDESPSRANPCAGPSAQFLPTCR